jgi:hypothetical protein
MMDHEFLGLHYLGNFILRLSSAYTEEEEIKQLRIWDE